MLLLCVLNLKFFSQKISKNTQVVKYTLFAILLLFISSFQKVKHPFFVSVIDINYKQKERALQLSVKLFTNDLEDALRKTSKKKIDILNPINKVETDSILFNYIIKRLNITINSKKQTLHFIEVPISIRCMSYNFTMF